MLQDIKTALRIKPKTWELRVFGIILAVIVSVIGHRFEISYLPWAGLGFLTVSLVLPRLLTYVVLVLLVLTAPIGWIVSRIILTLFFYLIVTPIAIIRRLSKHDTLHLRPGKEQSYWEHIEPNENHDKMHL